jgi:tetratricopeptide (TPR) repeat protein
MVGCREKCTNINKVALLAAGAIGLCCAIGSAPSLAQPPDQASGIETRDAAQIAREWAALRAAHLEEETTDPRAAIARYQKFYEERGRQSGAVSVAITSLIAQLYSQNLHERDKALEIYRWGVQQFAWHPDSAKLKREMELLQAGDKPNANGKPEVVPPDVPGAGVAPVLPPAVPAMAVPPAIHLGAPLIPGALKVLPSASAPLPVGMDRSGANPIPLNPAQSLKRVVFLAQLQAEPGHAEALWKSSGLSVDALPPLVEKADESDAAHKAARLAVAGLLVRYNGELLRAPEKPSSRLRLAVADYYASLPDEKAVALYEGLLQEWEKTGRKQQEPFALEKLAAYYQATNQFGKAAELMAQVEKYTTIPALVGNWQVQAGRLYLEAGDEEKAIALFQKVSNAQSNWGWAKGLALTHWSRALIAKGRFEEARKVLSVPVTGQHADQIKVELLTKLAYSYYREGNFATAQKVSSEAIAAYNSLSAPLQGEDLEGAVSMASGYLSGSQLWSREPVVCQPRALSANIEGPLRDVESVTFHLDIRTPQPTALNISASDARIRIKTQGDAKDESYYFRTEAAVEVVLHDITGTLDAWITVSSLDHPGFEARVPLHINIPKPIAVFPETVFFGAVAPGITVKKLVKVVSASNFRVLKLECDDPDLKVQLTKAASDGNEHEIEVIFTPVKGGRFLEGKIRLTTDEPGQRFIEIPYAAKIQ